MGRRIEEEKTVVEQMIRLYCQKCEGHAELCPSCKELLDYAHYRLDRCRYREDKPTCKKCPIHCYRPEMKEEIRKVMRWSGPRMIFYHPFAAIMHLLREIKWTLPFIWVTVQIKVAVVQCFCVSEKFLGKSWFLPEIHPHKRSVIELPNGDLSR